MSELVLPAPPQIWTPDYGALGERLRLPRWARPWERTKEDAYVEAASVVSGHGGGAVKTSPSGNTLAVTIVSPTVGNMLVAASAASTTISSISGGGVTTWSSANGPFSGDTNHNDEGIWWGVVDGTPSTSVTITYLSSITVRTAIIVEVTGAQKVLDTSTAFANDTQGATDSKTITTTTDGCCIISVIGVHTAGTLGALTGPTGYTQVTNETSGGNSVALAYLNQATHGASTMNWTALGTTTFPSLGAIAIKPASTTSPVSNTAGAALEALAGVANSA